MSLDSNLPVRAVVVDDETLSREKIVRYLKDSNNVEIVGEAATAAAARSMILARRPNLVFVDVRLPDSDGLSMAEDVQNLLGAETPGFIVSTAYENYALRSFNVHALDYLVKPYSRERFRSALMHARAQVCSASETQRVPPVEVRSLSLPSRVSFKSNGKLLVFELREIFHLRSADNYVEVHGVANKHLIRAKLSAVEKQLDANVFVRIHRSFIANIRHVREVDLATDDGDATVLLTNGTRLPLTRTFRNHMVRLLNTRSLTD
jgi:two-component system, LytTR family, response regulator